MAGTPREESSRDQAGISEAELALGRAGTERLIHQQSFQPRLFSGPQTCGVSPSGSCPAPAQEGRDVSYVPWALRAAFSPGCIELSYQQMLCDVFNF